MTPEEFDQYHTVTVGESTYSMRTTFKVTCNYCDEVIHERTNNPSAYFEFHNCKGKKKDMGETARYEEWLKQVKSIADAHQMKTESLISLLFNDDPDNSWRSLFWVECDKFATKYLTKEQTMENAEQSPCSPPPEKQGNRENKKIRIGSCRLCRTEKIKTESKSN